MSGGFHSISGSPPNSQAPRSRELSWSSVLMTPAKPVSRVTGRTINNSLSPTAPPQPIYAPTATQRSARRYCGALLVATVITGAIWSLGSPAILALLGPNDWRYFALARLVICVGAALPSPSLFRSIRAYVRAALDLRVLLWTLVLPALWLTLRSDLLPPVSLRQHRLSSAP